MKKERVKIYWYNILLPLIIILGIMLRLKGLLANPSFWHDECALAWNIKFKSYGELFVGLRFLQVAPPFFLVITKFLTQILGYSEKVFRLVPFLFGCFSIIAFYFLADRTLKVKSTVFWAVFLFAVNIRLINYSFEFKPYGVDVFFTVICLLLFARLESDKISTKKAVLYGTLFSLMPWFSFTSIFLIAGGFLNELSTNIKENLKVKLAFVAPILLSTVIYMNIYLIPRYVKSANSVVVDYWGDSFLTLNPLQNFYLFIESIRYLFFPVSAILFALILLIWGAALFYKNQPKVFKVSILSLMFLVIASFLHLYPYADRLTLFLTPICLLFMIKPLDEASSNKKIRTFIIIFLFAFIAIPQIISANMFVHMKNVSRNENPREMMQILSKNIKKNDYIFVNNASENEFEYYSSFYKFNRRNIIKERLANKPDARYLKLLNGLPKGNYWFYMPYDYSHTRIVPVIMQWAKSKEILYSFVVGNGGLFNILIK